AVTQDALKLFGQILFVGVSNAGIPDRFDVLRRGECQHAVAESHRLEQRWMRAANFRGVHVAIGVLLQRTIIASKNKTGKNDATIASRASLEIVDVFSGVRRVADDQKFVGSA